MKELPDMSKFKGSMPREGQRVLKGEEAEKAIARMKRAFARLKKSS